MRNGMGVGECDQTEAGNWDWESDDVRRHGGAAPPTGFSFAAKVFDCGLD